MFASINHLFWIFSLFEVLLTRALIIVLIRTVPFTAKKTVDTNLSYFFYKKAINGEVILLFNNKIRHISMARVDEGAPRGKNTHGNRDRVI